MRYSELRDAVFRLYGEGRYVEALALIAREAPAYPDEMASTAYWRACLYAVTGRREEALRVIREVLDLGSFFGTHQLRDEADFASLQRDPDFERLAAECARRQEAAQAKARPELLVVEPRTPPPWPLLLALHGAGSNAADSLDPWRPAIAAGWLLALPQSSQVWGSNGFVWNDRAWAAREIGEQFATLTSKYQVDRTVVGGFSNGGALAPWLVLTGSLPARGFVAVGPGARNPIDWPTLVAGCDRDDVRGVVIVGDGDAPSLEYTRALSGAMSARGLGCRVEIVPGLSHDYPADFGLRLDRALGFVAG